MPMKKNHELFLSRNFVEFGPFTDVELSGFAGRGLLLESDYVKETGGHVWQPCNEWLASLSNSSAPASSPNTPAKMPAKKRVVTKKKSKD